MAQKRLQPNIERKHHHHAFEVYRDLGFRRTYREVARQISVTPNSVAKWAKIYKWDERLAVYKQEVESKQEAGALVKIDDPVVAKITTLIEQTEALIDSVFAKDLVTGKKIPMIKITSADDLTKLISEYRKILESYYKFVAEYKPTQKETDRGTKIDKFNVFMGNMPQEERIKVMEALKHGDVPAGNSQSPGRVQDADYTEVPERGNED